MLWRWLCQPTYHNYTKCRRPQNFAFPQQLHRGINKDSSPFFGIGILFGNCSQVAIFSNFFFNKNFCKYKKNLFYSSRISWKNTATSGGGNSYWNKFQFAAWNTIFYCKILLSGGIIRKKIHFISKFEIFWSFHKKMVSFSSFIFWKILRPVLLDVFFWLEFWHIEEDFERYSWQEFSGLTCQLLFQ